MRECSQRAVVKVEYVNDPEAAAYNNTNLKLLDFDARPDQEYKPNQVSGESSGTKGKGTSNNKKGSNSSKNLSSINRSALSKSPEKETKGTKNKKEKKQFFDMMMQMQDAMQLQQKQLQLAIENMEGKDGAVDHTKMPNLGFVSHHSQNSANQVHQESVPPATQSTSRHNNTTGTGLVMT